MLNKAKEVVLLLNRVTSVLLARPFLCVIVGSISKQLATIGSTGPDGISKGTRYCRP